MTDDMHRLPDAVRAKTMSTDELRAAFLVRGLFQRGRVIVRHVDLDRVVFGGAVPMDTPLTLEPPASIKSEFFTQRRELGLLNIGARGSVTVDGDRHAVDYRDALYIGRGTKRIMFASDDAAHPARFYLVSYPAQVVCPTARIAADRIEVTELGAVERANRRRLAKYIYEGGVASAQLVMGVTELVAGSVWNTMPAHTHYRRTEVYLYFGIPEDALVVHLMGEPSETRHLVVRDGDVVLSPTWSVHAGCGTSSYSFCWAMGGENRDYTDMQPVDMKELR